MATTGAAVPGINVPSGSLVTPGGAQGVTGVQGPSGAAGPAGVSGDAGNVVVLGSDSLVYVPPVPAGVVWAYAGSGAAPVGWLMCDGSAVSRTTYPKLYTAIGATYGAGDGSTTFNLPDLRGRTAIGAGQGTGLTNRVLGAKAGNETDLADLAVHNHTFGSSQIGITSGGTVINQVAAPATGGQTTANAGAGGGHNTMQPYLALNYIIKT